MAVGGATAPLLLLPVDVTGVGVAGAGVAGVGVEAAGVLRLCVRSLAGAVRGVCLAAGAGATGVLAGLPALLGRPRLLALAMGVLEKGEKTRRKTVKIQCVHILNSTPLQT